MTMSEELEPYEDRRPVLPELIDYLRASQHRADLESGRPIINVIYNEAPRPAPVPPRRDPLSEYGPWLILATWTMIALAGVAVIFVMIAGALMTMMISCAVCALAVAAAIRSLRMSKEEARAVARGRRGRR
jgi:hypothetical protein